MVKQKHVCVIGAGISGLAAGKAFAGRGHKVTIIERSGDLGGVWEPAPDMGFVGFNSSFCTVLCADLAANWLVRYADGQLARQPSAAEMHDNIAMMLNFKRVERPAAGVYGGLCVAPYHFKHFDELLADIGTKASRRNPLVEKFTPPDADAYARFLATAPEYKAVA